MNRIPGELPGGGVAQATYDAAVAKLVTITLIDLTAATTTACAGAAAADPDLLAAGLTVTTTTGTFDGETVACNQLVWTTHTTTNDGHGETLNYDLGTITALFPTYNPATHGIVLVSDIVEIGALNSARPSVWIMDAPGGTMVAGGNFGVGWGITSATSATPLNFASSAGVGGLAGINPATSLARETMWRMPIGLAGAQRYMVQAAPGSNSNDARILTGAHTASDKLFLCLGQGNITQGAVTLKMRHRIGLVTLANIDFADYPLGCQA